MHSAIGSGNNDQVVSSDDATSSESTQVPGVCDPTIVVGEPNRWCVEA